MLNNLLPKVMGWVVVIITLALAPSIQTANATIEAANLTNLTGMTAISAFGAPLMIISLLFAGGLLGVAGIKGQLTGVSMKTMFSVIGAVVICILALNLFNTAITYINALIMPGGVTGFGDVIYGIIAIVLYLGIIAGAGAYGTWTYFKGKKGKKKSARAFA